jgi:L-threonylcarbamoyladenylate synthase
MMADVEQVLAALDKGAVVAVPTDTVCGLAARLDRPDAIRSIFTIKGRPADKALPILGANVAQLDDVAEFDADALKLAKSFWPGPLTLVLHRTRRFDVDLGGADDDLTVGVRVPDSKPLLELLIRSGPLSVTSANVSGQPPAKSIEAARVALGDRVAAYLEEGARVESSSIGAASTVVSLVGGFRLLREGPLDADELRSRLEEPD